MTKQTARPDPAARIKSRYLAEHDVVLVQIDWQLESPEDIEEWTRAWAQHFSRHYRKRKLDMIFELSKFSVAPRVRAAFGEARAKMLRTYTRLTYRVNPDAATKTAMYTSRVLHGAEANEFSTIEEALAQLKIDRAAGKGE